MKEFIEYIDKCLPDEEYEHKKLHFNHKENKYYLPEHDNVKGQNIFTKLSILVHDKVDSIFRSIKMRELLYGFKRHVLDEMNQQFDEASSRGVTNKEVFVDMVKSMHPDLVTEFENHATKEINSKKNKKKISFNIKGSIIFILALIVAFLAVGFKTSIWHPTWLIIVDGILLLVAYLLGFGVNEISKLKRAYYILARICLAFSVLVIGVSAFLFTNSLLSITNSWLFVIGGVAAMLISDGIYITVKKQRMAMINILVYIPIVAAMLYIIFAASNILTWGTGWLLVICGLVADAVIAISSYLRNKKIQKEIFEKWKED